MADEMDHGKIIRNMFRELFPDDTDKYRTTEKICKILNYYCDETKYTDSCDTVLIMKYGVLSWQFDWDKHETNQSVPYQMGKQLIEFLNKELLLLKLNILTETTND